MKQEPLRSDDIIAFCEKYLVTPEGAHVGRPIRLREWQKDIIRTIYDTPTRQAIVSMGRKNGKGLALDTPIPTPSGWRTMADIEEGDEVYGSDGRATRVVGVSRVHHGLLCWELTFSDGSTIVADEEHRWLTRHSYRPWARNTRQGLGVVTTPQIAISVHKPRSDGGTEHNHKIAAAPSLASPAVPLPIDPYLLGVWLGDGATAAARITVGDSDLAEMTANLEAVGALVTARRERTAHSVHLRAVEPDLLDLRPVSKGSKDNLQIRLRALGVLGRKHIPQAYLDAGTSQRWALLQGLMDTDGTISSGAQTRQCQYVSVSQSLVNGVWRLLRSLGIKARIRSGAATLHGEVVNIAYSITFNASADQPVFRMQRKKDRLPPQLASRNRTLSIVACRQVESVPTKCISVAAADKLYLAGHGCVPTHNTALVAMLVLAHVIGPEARRNAQIFSAAQSRDQASIVFNLASKMARMSTELSDPNLVTVRESRKELFSPLTGVTYKALAAEAATTYGFSPVVVIHDELGQVRGPRSELYDALETAMGAQEEPLSIVISTQAPTSVDLLSLLIDYAKAGADPLTKLVLFAAEEELPIDDEATWALANPALGDFLNVAEVRGLAEKAVRMPSFESAFRNLHLNQRVSALAQLFSLSIWEANAGEPDLDAFGEGPVYGGLDLSARQDLTALVLVAEGPPGHWNVWPHFWTPADTLRDRAQRDRQPYPQWVAQGLITTVPGVTIDYGFVAQRLGELGRKCRFRSIRFDRWRIDEFAAAMKATGVVVPLEEHGQGYRDMAPALDALETVALQGRIRHGGHPVMTMCASNAIVTTDPAGNRKLEKSKSSGRIDGMVALAMAMAAATSNATPKLDIRTVIG